MPEKQTAKAAMKPRYMRMTDTEWAVFREIGGVEWLRSRLAKLDAEAIAKRRRDLKIRKDAADGMSDLALSKKYNLDRVTIWRIRK